MIHGIHGRLNQRVLDSSRRRTHDRVVESPSFFQAMFRFPGAIIRFPSAAVDTLDAINDLAERIDRLVAVLEPFQEGIDLAGTGVNIATGGIAQALAGLQQAVERLDQTVPAPFSAATSQLRILAERLNGSALQNQPVPIAEESVGPNANGIGGEDLPEPPLVELELSMAELARSLDALVGAIPILRQIIRVTSGRQDPEDDEQP
jgi:hypothetical protein